MLSVCHVHKDRVTARNDSHRSQLICGYCGELLLHAGVRSTGGSNYTCGTMRGSRTKTVVQKDGMDYNGIRCVGYDRWRSPNVHSSSGHDRCTDPERRDKKSRCGSAEDRSICRAVLRCINSCIGSTQGSRGHSGSELHELCQHVVRADTTCSHTCTEGWTLRCMDRHVRGALFQRNPVHHKA